jgi:hypothetical protein
MIIARIIEKYSFLIGFNNVNLNEVFFLLKERERLNSIKFHDSNLIAVSSVFRHIFFGNYQLNTHLNNKFKSKVLFFYDEQYNYKRTDYRELFDSVVNCMDERKDVIIYKRVSFNFSVLTTLNLLILVPIWFFKFKFFWKNFKIVSFFIIRLIELYRFQRQISINSLKNYRIVTVFFDLSYNCNLLVQNAKKKKVKTATLQHGIMLSERDMSILDFSAPEFRGGISDYFLLWNQFTFTEAIKSGIAKDRLKILGISRCINMIKAKNPENNVFGVVMDGIHTDNCNLFMINASNLLSESFGYKYYLKIHPNEEKSNYNKFISKEHCLGVFDQSKSFYDYICSVEFSIVGNSTALFEMAYCSHKFFRFTSNSLFDKYKDIDIPSFKTERELLNLYRASYDEDSFKTLCTVSDIENSYFNFFISFL